MIALAAFYVVDKAYKMFYKYFVSFLTYYTFAVLILTGL